jgi:hypothetical protein
VSPSARTVELAGLSAAFVGLGMSGALPPAMLPVLGAQLGVPPGALSLVVSTMFAGLCLGVVLTAVSGAAVAPGRMVALGAAGQATGLVALALAGTAGAAAGGALLLGVGFGITEVSVMALARRAEVVAGRLLSQLTAVLAVTSAATPVAFALAAAAGNWRPAFLAAAVVQGCAAGGVLATARAAAASKRAGWWTASRPRRAHLAVFAYVGAEALIAAWAARLASSALDLGDAGAAATTAGFWVALALGRMGTARVLRTAVGAPRLLHGALAVSAGAFLTAAALTGYPRLLAVVIGLVCAGPVYGLIVATAPGTGDSRILAVLIAAGALGGSVVSGVGAWVFGVAQLSGVLFLAAVMLAIALAALRLPRRRAIAPALPA